MRFKNCDFEGDDADLTESTLRQVSRTAQSPVDFEALKLPPTKELVYDYRPLTGNLSLSARGCARLPGLLRTFVQGTRRDSSAA